MANTTGEGDSKGNLKSSYSHQENFLKSIEYYKNDLSVAKEVGDRQEEGRAYVNLGNTYYSLGNFLKAEEYHEKHLSTAKEIGDTFEEGRAYGNLGNDYLSLGKFQKAIEYHEKHLSIAKELEDEDEEGRACGNLGNAYHSLENVQHAIEYHEKELLIAKEMSNKSREGRAYGNLGRDYYSVSNFQKAIRYHEKELLIAKELNDKDREGAVYSNLGDISCRMGNFEKAIEYHKKDLSIAKEAGDRSREAETYGILGSTYYSLGRFQMAIEQHEKHLSIAKELGDKIGEGRAYGNLGNGYYSLGNFQKAIEYNQTYLSIAEEVSDKTGEGRAYGNLGNIYYSLGNFDKAIQYHKRHLRRAEKIRGEVREGGVYGNLGNAYQRIKDYEKAITNHERDLSIAKEVGNEAAEGRAYGNLGNAWYSLGNFERAIEYHEKEWLKAKEVGDHAEEGRAYGNLGNAYYRQKKFEKAKAYHEKHLSIAKEVGNKVQEGEAYSNLGDYYSSLGEFQEASKCYQFSVKLVNIVRASLSCEEALKMSFRDLHRGGYNGLWQSLLKLDRIDEALCAAEKGRAQALVDVLKVQYGLTESPSASLEPKETISYISNKLTTKTVFLAHQPDKIIFWVIGKGSKVELRERKVDSGSWHDEGVTNLLNSALKNIGAANDVRCEDRSLDVLDDQDFDEEGHDVDDDYRDDDDDDGKQALSLQCTVKGLQPLHDAIIDPIADLCQGDQLIIVPDGPLCLAPFSALSTSIRIRTVPSLTSLRLITDHPEECKSVKGALLVGDPYLGDVKYPKYKQLPCAREEVEMIGELLNIPPLTGVEAAKHQVLQRISSVSLVHIAAHGSKETGEIALAPNPGWEKHCHQSSTSKANEKSPKEDDYMLKIADVQDVKLRAKLVVLSCCHSGKGKVQSEGVVGIARAFLAAGACSVLVSLWAISDKATMEFMKSFYQHLADGKSASVALQQAMKFLRESEEFSAVKYWAPFQLIGDDVTLEFGRKESEHLTESLS